MKKNVFVAMLLAVVMVLSCMMVTVSAFDIGDNGKQEGDWIAYANAAVTPTVDGFVTEKVWNSTNEFNGVKVLWADKGFYFATGLNAEFTYADVATGTTRTVKVENGVVTGLPEGSKVAKGLEAVEIFAPYTNAFEWEWYGFKQYRTDGNAKHADGKVDDPKLPVVRKEIRTDFTLDDGSRQDYEIWWVAEEGGVIDCTFLTEASDLLGNVMKFNGKNVVMAGPYGYNYVIGGKDYYDSDLNDSGYWLDDDRSSRTGQDKFESSTLNNRTKIKDCFGHDLVTYQDPTESPMRYVRSFDPNGNILPNTGWQPVQLAYAVKVNAETAPIIDGAIDNVWETTAKMWTLSEIQNPSKDAWGYLSIMWDETGLYLLANIQDPNLTTAVGTDRCNFQISEYTTRNWNPHGTDGPNFSASIAEMNKEGSYAIGASPIGQMAPSSCSPVIQEALAKADKGGIKMAGQTTATGYVCEFYVPYFKLTAEDAKIGHVISFEGGADNYLPGSSDRDDYVNMGYLGNYWEDLFDQYDLVFVGEYDVESTEVSMNAVYDLINVMIAPYQKADDALTTDDIDMAILDFSDEINETIGELEEKIEALEASLADYQKAADALKAADVDAKLADYAKKADVDAAIDGIEIKDYTVVVIILFVLVVLEAAGIAFCFIKKK